MDTVKEISIVCPVFGAKKCLPLLFRRLKHTLSQLTEQFEIIFVSDACPENSWGIIVELCNLDPRVKGINLSRNFGQHYAITAGLDIAKGNWVVVMDCDLQDQPEEIIKFYEKAKEGYDIVVGQRFERQDSFFKRATSKAFYAILAYFTEIDHDSTIANFGIYSQKVIKSVLLHREQNRSFPLLIHLVGFKKYLLPISHSKREHGKSSYTIKKMINLAIDSIVTHSDKPLRLVVKLGFIVSVISVSCTAWLIGRFFLYGIPVHGWTSLMVSIFFMFGLLFGALGVLGIYIGKIFDETKNRPLYIVQDKINLD